MNAETAIAWIDRLLERETGKHLNDLQILIIRQIWQGKKYLEIAQDYHCTEGHVKDIAAALWQLLSQVLGERATKTNLKAIVQRHLATTGTTPTIANYHLLGREMAIARLAELIAQGQRTIVIQGEGGIGKTTLAQEYLKTCGCELILELSMAKETASIAPAAIVVEEWLQQDLQIEPGREFSVTLLRLKRQLQARKIGVLIDNLEPALDRNGLIVAEHRSYVELLRILTDRQLPGITLITSRDRLCDDLNLAHYRLAGLDLATWQTYFSYRQIANTAPTIAPLHRAYGGNPKAMEIIAGNICADDDRDLAAYLRAHAEPQLVETGLRQLISSQFDRLHRLDPAAYQLLCRAGCYRYQDLARVSVDALTALLWDVDAGQRATVVAALKNRSLLEYQRGEYWLHPAVRAEAIARSRGTADWTQAHDRAARFWSDSVTKILDIQTAITALEAYYHYLEIGDIGQAAAVLLAPRVNQWGQFLPLASNLYRMGAIQPVLTAIGQIIPALPPSRTTAELANILGDVYWITGSVHQAIAAQQSAIAYTTHRLASAADRDTHYLKILHIDSLLSVGLYRIDLGELTAACELFQLVMATAASNRTLDRWHYKAVVCLALVCSSLGDGARAAALLQSIESTPDRQQSTGSSAYFLQIIGQAQTNLGNYARAHAIYQQTLAFCHSGNYLQIQGRTLTGLAQLDRLQGNLCAAQTTHCQAIELLDRLGAKCDLAAAYYQAGLTCYEAHDRAQAQIYCDCATKLFTEIAAPRQLALLAALETAIAS